MSSLFDEFTVFMSSFVMKLKRVHCVTSSPVAILKVSVVYPEKYWNIRVRVQVRI